MAEQVCWGRALERRGCICFALLCLTPQAKHACCLGHSLSPNTATPARLLEGGDAHPQLHGGRLQRDVKVALWAGEGTIQRGERPSQDGAGMVRNGDNARVYAAGEIVRHSAPHDNGPRAV